MGGAVSSGESNDDLIDNLLEADYIKSPRIERVFRAVDRAFYYTEPYKQNAYKDLAWKDGNLHLSAPCIYSEVLENLDLGPGMSFLNIGSGTGYFSTMCGLILGRNGINHGIELYAEVVNYARIKLEDFQRTSTAMDEFDFCPPDFTVGNCLDAVATSKRYDRIYCGAACPNDYVGNLIDMLKLGGICVVPIGDSLVQITRVEETKDDRKILLPVTFATLLSPKENTARSAVELQWSPKKLTDLCRSEIRTTLRQTIVHSEHKNLTESRKMKRKRRQERRRASRLVVVQRRRSGGEADGDNGFVAFAYSVGSNSSDEERNQDLEGQNNQNLDESSETSSEDSADNSNDSEGKDRMGVDEDTNMEDQDTEVASNPVINGNTTGSTSTGNTSEVPKNGGVAVATGSCPVYSATSNKTVNSPNSSSNRRDIGQRPERRSVSAVTSRSGSTRSSAANRSSRTGRNYSGAESLLGRIRDLVRARQSESLRRQIQRISDTDNSRSRSASSRNEENSSAGRDGDNSGRENSHAESIYSDITSSDSSPSASASSTSDEDAAGGSQSANRCKRCRNESDGSACGNKCESVTKPKPDPLLTNASSVQMRQKILDLPLPPALKVYLNYNRKLYY